MEKIVIQSDIANLIEVERFVANVCDTYNINNYAATISMSLLQAVENAIVHGNHSDATKTVTVVADYVKGGVSFVVEDQGNGFDFAQYGSMPMEEGRGTGIFRMKSLSDHLSLDNNGRTVKMEFFINGIDAARALERRVTLHNFYSSKLVNA